MQSLRSLTACLHFLVLFAEQGLSQSVPEPHLGLRANLPRQITSITTTVVTPVQSTATVFVTATAGTSTNTPTPSIIPTIPSSTGPLASRGSAIGSLIGLIAFFILLAFAFWFCLSRWRRTRGTATGFWGRTRNIAPHELQATTTGTAAEIQPAANQEVYGYYAPPAAPRTTEPTPTAVQEVHGYYAPMVAPRMGDVIPARPSV